jgi:hypothetical protein
MTSYGKYLRYPPSIADQFVLGDADEDYRAKVTPEGKLKVDVGLWEPLGTTRVSEKTPVIQIYAGYGLSHLRDNWEITNDSYVNNRGDIFTVSGVNSQFYVESNVHGHYTSGISTEALVSIRIPTLPTGTQNAMWGYWGEDEGGPLFGMDSGGLYIGIANVGGAINYKVYQEDWNFDALDGTGPSGLTITKTNGYLYGITLVREYGTATFFIVAHNSTTNNDEPTIVHKMHNHTRSDLDNAPLSLLVSNGATPGTDEWYVTMLSRSYYLIGKSDPDYRINSMRTPDVVTVDADTIKPILSIRRKEGRWDGLPVQLASFDMFVTADAIVEIRQGGTLDGASWQTPTNTTETETALEVDITSSGITGGELLWSGMSSGSTAMMIGSGNEPFGFDIPNEDPITLCATTTSGYTTDILGLLRWKEAW